MTLLEAMRCLTRGVTPWAAVALVWAGCVLVTDFDYQSGAGGSSTSTSSSGGGGAGGGDAGGGGCGGADLESDPKNCGECGFECDAHPCVDGACFQCIDLDALGAGLDRVVFDGELLYFVQHIDPPGSGGAGGGGGADGGGGSGGREFEAHVRTLPVSFKHDEPTGLNYPIENGVSMMAVGGAAGRRVYVTGQVSSVIYACNESGCSELDVGGSGIAQMQGMTAIEDELFFLSADNRMFKVDLDATGSPTGTPTLLVATYAEPIPNAGAIELFHTLEPTPRLYWGSYDVDAVGNGCLYRVDVDDLPLPQTPGQPCYTAKFASQGFVVSTDGVVYAQDGPTTVRKIVGDPPPTMTLFDDNASFPRGLDQNYLYVKDSTSGGLRAIPLSGGPDVKDFTQEPGLLYGLDTRHPRYVVGTIGTRLCRWPKPKG